MKSNKRVLKLLFIIIFVLCLVAGYSVYKSYTKDQNNPVYEEEINLGLKACPALDGCDSQEYSFKKKKCVCTKCSLGYKQDGNGCTLRKTKCNEGYYLDDGECYECEQGKVCIGGTFPPAYCTDFDTVEDCPSLCNWWESTKECRSDAPGKVPCAYVSVSLPSALSPDSKVNVGITISSDLPSNYDGYCRVSYNIAGNSGTYDVRVRSGGDSHIDLDRTPDGGFTECQDVTLSYSIPGGKSFSNTIKVKTNFSTTTKNRNLSGTQNPPRSKEDADAQGTSYYIASCADYSTKQNCEVYTRDLCSPKPACYYNKENWSYCWGTNCGEGYVQEPNVKEADCINVCYCNKEKNYCDIWALKDWTGDASWEGYKLVKNGNNYVTDKDKCKMPYDYCCVDNGTLELSSNAKYYESQADKVCPSSWTALENVKKEDCVIKEEKIGSCSIGKNTKENEEKANSCEGTTKVELSDTTKCTDNEHEQTNFYEIACTKTIKTQFDYGNDENGNTLRSLYKGEGFAFGINVETTLNCKYVFYEETWNNAYNSVKESIKKIDSNLLNYLNNKDAWEKYINDNILNKNGVNNASKLYWYWNLADKLREAVKAYNEDTPKRTYNEQSELTLTTYEKGKQIINKYKLKQVVKDEGTYIEENVKNIDLKVSGVTNPKSYTLKSNNNRKVALIPARVCINKGTDKITTIEGDKCPENTLDGGNKIYISSLTDKTENNTSYPIEIKVTGLGAINYTINHDKCDLKVDEGKYIYRPIDVSNPFINSKWQKGKNWINEIFDFTKIIHSNTWSDNSNKKVITLTSKEIVSLKESNSRAWKDNNSPYMGLCDKQSITLQDEITKKLCSLIK